MTEPSRTLPPSALERMAEIAATIKGRRLAVFVDFDGTLAPIAERPEQAKLGDEARRVLAALAERCPVAVVSGRDRVDVERRVGLDGIAYAGNHGFDIKGAAGSGIRHQVGAPFAEALERVRRRLESETAAIGGTRIEVKAASIAVHYRQADPSDVAAVSAAVETAVAAEGRGRDRLRLLAGKKVFEILPDIAWNKGQAVLWLSEALGLGGEDAVAVYLGDDTTDEEAFRVLAGRGVGVRVGTAADLPPEGTAAPYALADPAEVTRFLDALGR